MSSVRLRSSRWIPLGLLGVVLVAVLPAGADGPVLHEFVPPDPNEDVALAATTLDGNFPAALDTPSGPVTAPDPQRPPDPDHLYAGGTTDDTPESKYEPDRDTRQPTIENYEDPFSPSTAPFKRLRAYDSVTEDYTLEVANKGTSLVTTGGEVDGLDEAFYADFSVELRPDDLVRVPSVGPGARVIKMHLSPDATASLLKDGADNWFLRGTERKRVRVVMQIAIPRATFGSELADPEWSDLRPKVPAFTRHDRQAQQVFAAIGISASTMRPKAVVAKMVEYYRGFQPSDQVPNTHGDMFLDLALSKKGVCRHRAFAFLITALEIGIPTRMVVNEAHAWVEVFDGQLWHRIDLGGAALDLADPPDPTKPQHKPPSDPFEWPDDAKNGSGQNLADDQRKDLANGGDTSTPGSSDPGGTSAEPTTDPSQPTPTNPSLKESTLEVEIADKSVRRGENLRVTGKVSGAQTCRNVRVDVVLRAEGAPSRAIGSLSTDEEGVFAGTVVVPRDLTAGDYSVIVVTRGDQRCGAGRSE